MNHRATLGEVIASGNLVKIVEQTIQIFYVPQNYDFRVQPSQILNLKDHELDLLADFLGHNIRIHGEFYRLSEHTLQVAKASKILMAMGSGQITKQARKTLDNINIDAEEGKLINLKR